MEELSKKDILTLIGENLTTIRRPGYKGFDESKELDEMPLRPDQLPKKEIEPGKPTKKSKKIVLTLDNGEEMTFSTSQSVIKVDGENKNTVKVTQIQPGDVIVDDNRSEQTVSSVDQKEVIAPWTAMFETDNDGKPIEHVGWYRYENGEVTPIIFTCEWDELTEKHPDLVPKLKEKFGKVKLKEENCPSYKPRGRDIGGVKPIPGDDGEEVTFDNADQVPDATGSKTTYTREKINRTFNSILKDELVDDEDFVTTLKRISLPEIVILNPKHRNKYSEVNDKEITFQSHNINLYKTQEEFQNTTRKTVMRGRTPEYFESDEYNPKKSNSLRRQYNQGYSNWSKTRFTQQGGGYGKTPVFKLDRGDFPNEEDFSVMVSSDLEIKGIAQGEGEMTSGYRWELVYTVEYAKKLPTDRVARKIFKDEDVSINLFVDVYLSEEKDFDGKVDKGQKGEIVGGDTGDNHPLTDVNIVQGLKEILDNFKKEMSSKKQFQLAAKRAQMTRQDVDTADMRLNEEEIKDIIKKTINKK